MSAVSGDAYDLRRFIEAQQPLYLSVCAELAAGEKRSHWMWFIFPQLRGLGSSPTARHFGIGSLAEARAYLAHPLLGERLRECTRLVNGAAAGSAEAIFGHPDYLKFRSCLTLFAHAAGEPPAAADGIFGEALARYYGGEPDPATLKLLSPGATSAF
jgi:uncharacterized protein (DUF1810 family)